MATIIFVILSSVYWLHSVESQLRIIGGSRAAPGKYPYQVSVQPEGRNGWYHSCGNAIVTHHHVVTAAHCVAKKKKTDRISIWAGTTRLDSGGIRYAVDSWIYHPDFIDLHTADIAIIRTQQQMQYIKGRIQPIGYSNKYIGGDVLVVLTGWGAVQPNKKVKTPPPNDLQVLSRVTMTNANCKRTRRNLSKDAVCTVGERGQGACRGDSGGPLASKGQLVGVVSFGPVLCGNGETDVYTQVSPFAAWIRQNTQR